MALRSLALALCALCVVTGTTTTLAQEEDALAELLDYAIDLVFDSDDADFRLDASAVSDSHTDLSFTTALTLWVDDIALNLTLSLSSERCDLRNLGATVGVDLVTPTVLSSVFCDWLGWECETVYVATELFSEDVRIEPEGGWSDALLAVPLNFSVDLTPWNSGDGVFLMLDDVEPMFTGMEFGLKLEGIGMSSLSSTFSNCSALTPTLLSLGVSVDNLDVDEGLICQFLQEMIRRLDNNLQAMGLAQEPLDVGLLLSTLFNNQRQQASESNSASNDEVDDNLGWLSSEGRVTIGANSAFCQVTPDPFQIILTDIGGETLDSLVTNTAEIVGALVDAANECLGGGDDSADDITDLNFDDVNITQNDDGTYEVSGVVYGGAGKNPAGILSCLSDNLDEIDLSDGSELDVGDVTYTEGDDECLNDEQYHQCDGSTPYATTEAPATTTTAALTTTRRRPETTTDFAANAVTAPVQLHDSLTLGLAIGITIVVMVVVGVAVVMVLRKSMATKHNAEVLRAIEQRGRNSVRVVDAVLVTGQSVPDVVQGPSTRGTGPAVKTESH